MGNQVCCATNCNHYDSDSPRLRSSQKSKGREMTLVTHNAYDLQVEQLEEGLEEDNPAGQKKKQRPKTPEGTHYNEGLGSIGHLE